MIANAECFLNSLCLNVNLIKIEEIK